MNGRLNNKFGSVIYARTCVNSQIYENWGQNDVFRIKDQFEKDVKTVITLFTKITSNKISRD